MVSQIGRRMASFSDGQSEVIIDQELSSAQLMTIKHHSLNHTRSTHSAAKSKHTPLPQRVSTSLAQSMFFVTALCCGRCDTMFHNYQCLSNQRWEAYILDQRCPPLCTDHSVSLLSIERRTSSLWAVACWMAS